MKEINKKLMAVQQQLRAPKSQYNEFNKFNYRNAEDILEAVKPILATQGLTLVLSDQMEYIGERYYIKATATLSDGEDTITATAYAREDESRAGMSESQVTGCSSSYARKYCLNGLFCIDDGKDSDSFNNRKTVQQPTPVVQPAKPQNRPVAEPEDLDWTPDPPKDNLTILRDFCGSLKGKVDNSELKKFFLFYEKRCSTWQGKIDPERLWQRWQETSRKVA